MSASELRFIAVDGVLRRKNTLLAKAVARRLNGREVLEETAVGPMIEVYSHDPDDLAFKKQLLRLIDRFKVQKQIVQTEIFYDAVVSDYLLYCDRIHAHLRLKPEDLSLYETLLNQMERELAIPDLVIYLQSSPDYLMDTLRDNYAVPKGQRSRPELDEAYIRSLVDEYNQFFLHFRWSPLLIVNAVQFDPENPHQVDHLIAQMSRVSGIRYYNPTP